MNLKIKGKKGYSISGWVEGIILSLLVFFMVVLATNEMNGLYGKTANPIMDGLGIKANESNALFTGYQSTLQNEIGSGEAEFDATQGLTLKSSWGILKNIGDIIWKFIGGGWIQTITGPGWMNLPIIFGWMFRILYFISIGLIILYLLFKVEI